jgi:3-methylcrotonyl-CoA carboxylase alpha subunit
LVEWQLRVASGEKLPKAQGDLSINGWAMEVRLYAEDPAKGFLPSIGRLDSLHFPDTARVDTGVYEGAAVSPFYDPMIAKLIVHRATRDEAIDGLRDTLDRGSVGPLITNSGFLYRLLGEQPFRDGDVTTGYIDAHVEALTALPEPSGAGIGKAVSSLLGARGSSPWESLLPFRLNAAPRHDLDVADQFGRRYPVTLTGAEAASDGTPAQPVTALGEGGDRFLIRFPRGEGGAGGAASDGAILSPMPGKIIAVAVAAGDKVAKGQKIVTVEAMKMEHSLVAPFDGIVAELNAVEGGQINEGALLAKIEKEEA